MAEINQQITKGANDGRRFGRNTSSSSFDNNGTVLHIGTEANGVDDEPFLYYEGVSIPSGASVVSSQITFNSGASLGLGVSMRIYALKKTSPLVPNGVSSFDFGLSSMTTNFINWQPTAWVSGSTYNTPDLSSIINELVGIAGNSPWISGTSVCFYFLWGGNVGNHYRDAVAYDGTAAKSATFDVIYQPAVISTAIPYVDLLPMMGVN